jgi:NAD(P)-dependent dehydrogenase (short-subunit alcohol dehydrogenase family)
MMNFDKRVAIVTGAGNGLGRSHALAFARRGARVVVNDLGAQGQPSDSTLAVVEEIRQLGGSAMANGADVANFEQVADLVERVKSAWSRVDILVNNAGILRDKSFVKMEMDDFDKVIAVHLRGSANCIKAVWQTMRDQNYGRIVLTSSSSGLYGNFGQANYGAAKAAMVGLMNVLHLEGAKHDIRVNVLAPTAATAMTEGLLSADVLARLAPDAVSPAVLFLTSDEAPSRMILGAGAGAYAVVHVVESEGVYLPPEERTPENLAVRLAEMSELSRAKALTSAYEQTRKYVEMALRGRSL